MPLYFALSVYIFARFASSHPYPWLLGVLLFSIGWRRLFINTLLIKLIGLTIRSMGRNIVGNTISEGRSIIGVFYNLMLIQYESNIPSINKYSWISAFNHCIGSFSYKTLNKDLAIIIFDVFIQTLCFLRKLQSFYILLLFISLKSSSVYLLKSF